MKHTRIEVMPQRTPGLAKPLGWYWHIKTANGKIICQGEGHPTKANAIRAAKGVVNAITASHTVYFTQVPAPNKLPMGSAVFIWS